MQFRPIVEVVADSTPGNGADKREIDLSLSPLVSIIETVESPDVGRVSFRSDALADRRSKRFPRSPINLRPCSRIWMRWPAPFRA